MIITSSFHDSIAQSFESVILKWESCAIISLQTERDGTGECKIFTIDHDNVILTSSTLLLDQFSTTTTVWGHVFTLPSNTVYHVALQAGIRLFMRKISLIKV